ncbi:RHS repeat-associated core domain-containing protein [Pseudomonas putida]|uniref:RHS repeat-associated core domain-containing protein n=1 Tax=Pseudomonas putida TaxID=303 RepID=UPI00236594F0|nr:RHS repeat-associated core domain-containing protein [Pseudomonas putida]MDD2050733.1 hypothetical protein [Pseudomonas putida]
MYHHTPTLTVHEGRGLKVRQVAYHRAEPAETTEPAEPAQARITASTYDLSGRAIASRDPRLFAQGGEPNQSTIFSLSGTPLLTLSVDAGWRLSLGGVAGQVLENWDSRDSHWQTDYDALLRPVQRCEQVADHASRVAERFSYAGMSAEEAAHNRCGRMIRHDDNAGSLRLNDYDLGGQVLSETRRFLASVELPDWPDTLIDRDALLERESGATSLSRPGPTGEVLEQTDAQGNRRILRHNVAGALRELQLTLVGGQPQRVLSAIRYNAFAQVEAQTAGNGVISQAEYDPADGRLRRLSATRNGRQRLQDLVYDYDPVGNVLSIEDLSQPIHYFANQRVEPISEYRYDSLYQLIEASGREALGASIGPGLPGLSPIPGDTSQLLNYRQFYQYDAGGNLQMLRHVGQQSYTRRMLVSDSSNRALPWPDGSPSPEPDNGFDANGNLHTLQPGQSLRWDALNQLRSTRQVARAQAQDDQEQYVYDAGGKRLRKVTTRQARVRAQCSEVRYLPGLEIRSDSASGERLAVLTLQAGRCSLRCLHWSEGKPDGIGNDQLRYSLDDHLGSSTLELDAEAAILSHEGYYPYGGTAWWAAHSALEAQYKTIRYSGKERDASGLYYYGFRYYAPWLQRWINPDPAGNVDGLNLYRMVVSNPVTYLDVDGLTRGQIDEWAALSGSTVASLGLANFDADEQYSIKTVLGNAYNVLDAAILELEYLKDLVPANLHPLQEVFGPDHSSQHDNIRQAWLSIKNYLVQYGTTEVGAELFLRFTGSPGIYAAVLGEASDARHLSAQHGHIAFGDSFFSNDPSNSAAYRTRTIIHEISHHGRILEFSGDPAPQTKDYWYLCSEGVRERSFRIMKGGVWEIGAMVADDVRPENEPAFIAAVAPWAQRRSGVTVNSLEHAVKYFNATGPLRTHLAINNADTLAHGAMRLYDVRRQHLSRSNAQGGEARRN